MGAKAVQLRAECGCVQSKPALASWRCSRGKEAPSHLKCLGEKPSVPECLQDETQGHPYKKKDAQLCVCACISQLLRKRRWRPGQLAGGMKFKVIVSHFLREENWAQYS